MTNEELTVVLRNDIKTLRDISKTMTCHGFYKTIPTVLENVANDISEYLESEKVMLDQKTPIATIPVRPLDGRESVLSKIEKMQA